MRLGDSHIKNEVPSSCAYSEAKPFLGERICSKTRGVYVVNWGVRIVGPFFYCTDYFFKKIQLDLIS